MPDNDPTVRKIMIEDPRRILPQAPVARAAQIMVQSGIRHLVVTESDGEVVGVLSERQVLKHFSPWLSEVNDGCQPQGSIPRCQVQEIMAQPPVTVTADTSIRAAAVLLASKKIGCLPVVERCNRLIGLTTSVDVLKFIGRHDLPESEERFEIFRLPAFLSKDSEFTIPAGYFPQKKPQEELFAVLAYAPKSKRIGVRLLTNSQEDEDFIGARPATFTDKYVVIPAEDFLKHHNLNIRGALEVSENDQAGYLVLSPMLEP